MVLRTTVVVLLALLHGAAAKAAALDAAAPVEGGGPLARIRGLRTAITSLTREQLYAGAWGAAGAAVGLATQPTMTDPLAGRVATPEAWRRRVKAKRPITLLARSPFMLVLATVSYSVAEYAQAFPTHGPVDSLQQVLLWRTLQSACASVDRRSKKLCDEVLWPAMEPWAGPWVERVREHLPGRQRA